MTLSPPKVVLLDRDGVINHDSDKYIKSVDEWHAIDGSLKAIADLHHAGYRLGIITNQSGVGRGLYSMETLGEIHRHMLEQIQQAGGDIQRIFVCPHTPDDNCDCRKPKPGLLYQAAEHFACGSENMVFIGDKASDVAAARAAGAAPGLVRTGYGKGTVSDWSGIDLPPVYDDLASFIATLPGTGL